MNKKTKWLVALLSLVGLFIGMTSNPKVSEAFTDSYPASTVYYEIVDRNGDPFSIPLNMEAVYVTGTYGPNPATLMSVDPLLITSPSKNVFAFHLPAFSGTVTSGNDYYGYVSRVKVTTPLPYLKGVGMFPVGSPHRNNTFNIRQNYMGTITYNTGSSNTSIDDWIKNSDDTWNLRLWRNSTAPTIGGYENWSYNYMTKRLTSYYSLFNGLDGDMYRVYLIFNQVKELFEDETGSPIPAPSGYKNDNAVDIIDQPFNYQMKNDSSLPKTYVDSGFIYTYKGWYKGVGNQSSIVTTHPPTIKFNPNLSEPQNEVHIVYNKRALRIVDEEYIDSSSATIDPSWNNMGQQKADGDTFTQTPAATKTDSSGTDWEYQGWKLGTEPMSSMRPKTTPVSVLIDANKKIQYVYKKKQHTITTKLVDASDGVTLVPRSGNVSTMLRDDNSHFWGYPAATITDSSSGVWDYVGWENVTDAAGTINPSTTAQVLSIKENKEIRYHYKARNTTATLDLTPTPQVVMNGGNVAWSSRLTNTGTSALNNLKLKATSNWATGLSAPTQVTVTPASGPSQNFTISPVDWVGGFNLTGISIPNVGPNNYADITFTDTATGAVNQVLPAEIEVSGNIPTPVTAENFVRIDDPDEPNLNPMGNAGLINIPDFRFGEVEVKPYAQKKGLDATEYQAGYNPYIRYKDNESTGTYSLAVKMSPFTSSGSKTLPATTSILLEDGTLKEVQNYNKPNESLSAGTYAGPLRIFSDNTTSYIAFGNTQGVYQLDYAFNDVELELDGHAGIAGLSYTATLDWTLTTAP